jgi:GTP cyclohydrolase II
MTQNQDFPSPSARAPDQIDVDRAISELRRGGVVAIRDRERDNVAIIVAAELLGPVGSRDLAGLAGSAPVLAITGQRARAMGLSTNPDMAQTIALTAAVDDDRVHRLVDPTHSPTQAPSMSDLTVLPASPDGLGVNAIKLMKLARLLPAAVVALVAPLGPMSADRWAAAHSLLLVDVDAISDYSDQVAVRLTRAAAAHIPLAHADNCEVVAFRPFDGGTEHLALKIGEIDFEQPVLVRLHSQCLTGDLLGSLRCDCGDQLQGAIKEINTVGSGILLYLAQEGRNIGLINKLRAYALQDQGFDTIDANLALGFDADERLYRPAAEMLRQLGVSQVRLMTNNPEKLVQLEACGIKISERVAHVFPSNQHNEKYLQTKAERSGHLI